MPLDWLNVPLDTPVSELLARGRRSRAIEALRERLLGRLAPSPEVRLQLVDLLVEAGRRGEAIPILLGLADEFATDGFVAKAVAALKRIEALEPRRRDVERRLASLVQQQQAAELAPPAKHAVPPGDDTLPPQTPAAAPEPALPPPALPPPPPGGQKGFRGVVQRFVASLTEEGPRGAAPAPPPPPAALAVPVFEEDAPIAVEPIEVGPEELSEAAFGDQLLDLAEHVVQQNATAPREPTAPARERLIFYAERLLASALFNELREEELLAVMHDLRLLTYEAGEIVVSEGERSEGLFILVTGGVKVFVRSPTGKNVAVAELVEGQFFGEIASLSGRPRSATVTAAAHTELLILDGPGLRSVTTRHSRIGRALEDAYVERAGSPDVAAVRNVRLADQELRRRGNEVLEAHFGQSRWDPRVKLRLADLLLRTDKHDDAVAVLVGLADDLAREGFPEKSVAVLKKIERIRGRHLEQVSLAPLAAEEAEPQDPMPEPSVLAPPRVSARPRIATDDFFQSWLVDVLRDRVHQVALVDSVRGYRPGLEASPLFYGLGEDELLAVIRGLRLLSAEAGDILVTEGEPSDSVFILAAGTVRVFVEGAEGKRWPIGTLPEGSFFGEIGVLSGRPRSATVVAASGCELLELDLAALERITASHPRVRAMLERVGAARSAARARLGQRE